MGLSAGLIGELDMVGDWGVLTTDAGLLITGWNRWLERHLGRPAEAFLGKPLFDVFPNLLARRLDHYYQQALGGQTVLLSQRLHKYLLPLPPPVATERFEFMQQTARILPLVDAAAVCGTVTLVEDVTERVAYESELRDRLEALREADRRKDEFLAMLAHELRNPLAPISNAVHLLRMVRPADPMLVNGYNMIERQVTHLVRLVDDLLDVSRVSRGKITLQKMGLDLAAVVQQAVETSRPQIDARRHQLTVRLPPEPVPVEGDFIRLAQVVSNLLNNAAKYTDEGGQIILTVDRLIPSAGAAAGAGGAGAAGKAVIRVRDNGRGIDRAALKSLFDLFYQSDTNLDRSDGGLGIGLSLVKSLVEMHGGQVVAQSAGSGQGSEFSVYLPLLRQDEPAGAAAPAPASPVARPARILIVDDSRDSADSMAMVLKLDGHEVWTAYDGNKAVEIAARERPNVVLMDIGLPGLNGYQASQAIRAAGLTDTLLIAMTGYAQEDDRRLTREACFDAHLVKPVDLAVLRQLLVARAVARAVAR
jgi:signal transduction histidine kinase/ActR/RegA family two-component response regulator